MKGIAIADDDVSFDMIRDEDGIEIIVYFTEEAELRFKRAALDYGMSEQQLLDRIMNAALGFLPETRAGRRPQFH